MSIKIHHGAPGSYKTAGAVTDDLIPALKAGRSLVTNVRGINLDVLHEHFDLPDTFELHWVDTTTSEGREKAGKWFRWAPIGALIFFDEAQSIFPKRWRDSDLEKFSIPLEQAKEENRPANWWDAWDMHRHYNWDVILTTPDISKIRQDIRDASELAYKHKNQGLYGVLFKGSYLEGIHSKDNDGSSKSHFLNVRHRRILNDALTWKLYQSTTTGEVQDTIAGFSLFSSPRLVIGFAVLACCLAFIGYNGLDVFPDRQPTEKSSPYITKRAQVDTETHNIASGSLSIGSIGDQPDLEVSSDLNHPLYGSQISYNGFFKVGDKIKHFFNVIQNGRSTVYDLVQLEDLGYIVEQISDCRFYLEYNGQFFSASCHYS